MSRPVSLRPTHLSPGKAADSQDGEADPEGRKNSYSDKTNLF